MKTKHTYFLAALFSSVATFVISPAAQAANTQETKTPGTADVSAATKAAANAEMASPAPRATREDVEKKQNWRDAVGPAEKEKARKLFREGNDLVKESLFVQAVEKYETALTIWDHPAIHYNLALALINLDKPTLLRQHLLASLKYGEEALGEDKAKRAEQYLRLVEKQLTEVTIKSDQAGVKVDLDGRALFTGPGEYSGFVEPGAHTLQATKEGLEPTVRPLDLTPGKAFSTSIQTYHADDWVEYERRWPVAGPIIVTAAGAAVAGTGGVLMWLGSEEIKNYDAELSELCPSGCSADEQQALGFQYDRDKGEALGIAGIATLATGGAALVTGSVLLYMNRKRSYRVDPDTGKRLSFVPVLSPGYMGLIGQGTF